MEKWALFYSLIGIKSVNDLMVKSVSTNSNKSNLLIKILSNKICNYSKNWTNLKMIFLQFKNNKRNGLGFYKFFNTNNKFLELWKNT